MNFGKGGQNIVQAGSNNPNVFRNAGGLLNKFLGTRLNREERDYHRTKDEESRIRVNKAQTMDRAGAEVFKALVLPGAAAHGATKAYAIANETLGEDHPDVIAGTKPATTLKHPEMAKQVNNYGFDVGYRPAKTPPSKVQAEARADLLRGGEEITKQSDGYSGTVARFGKDGKITREPVSYGDIGVEESFSERPPASMREIDDSTRPSNQTWTDQQKAALERERPRTNNLNDGINDGKGRNSNPAEVDVGNAWGEGKITSEEAVDLIPGKSRMKNDISEYGKSNDNDDTIQATHTRAGLKDRNGTKY